MLGPCSLCRCSAARNDELSKVLAVGVSAFLSGTIGIKGQTDFFLLGEEYLPRRLFASAYG
jgi:hypothetical protein